MSSDVRQLELPTVEQSLVNLVRCGTCGHIEPMRFSYGDRAPFPSHCGELMHWADKPMSRWRVKFSRTTPTWFHACEVVFLDAPDADAARVAVESKSAGDIRLDASEIVAATSEMEQAHHDWLARVERWRVAAARGEAHRGLL